MEAIEDARKAAEAELGRRAALVLRHPRRGRARGRRGDRPARGRTLRPEGLVSFGLGGPEIGVPRPQFKPYFDRAIAAGPALACRTPGETTGPADRSGTRSPTCAPSASATAPAPPRTRSCWRTSPSTGSPLEVCPTSNIATRAVADLDEHPIKEMVAAGVLVTINSDDPPMFGTDLNNEYAVAARLLDLDERGLAGLAKNAVEASFLDPAGKAPAGRRDRHVHRGLARAPDRTVATRTAPEQWAHAHPSTAVAHRGDPYRVRENTLPSLRSALDRGADAVEIDVRLTRDGVPVLLHDETLERLWGHDRPLDRLTHRGGARADRRRGADAARGAGRRPRGTG